MANIATDSNMNSPSPTDYLKDAIRLLLEAAKNPMSEYQLIAYLNAQGWGLSLDASDTTVLFKTHFWVYHALYGLQVEYWEQQQRLLDISALSIGFISAKSQHVAPAQSASMQRAVSAAQEPKVSFESHQALRDYYLDLSHLEKATEDSVNTLLNQFWSRYVAEDDRALALSILNLPPTANLKSLKQRYRSLAMEHHPDRGGESEQFQNINWAWGVLRKCVSE